MVLRILSSSSRFTHLIKFDLLQWVSKINNQFLDEFLWNLVSMKTALWSSVDANREWWEIFFISQHIGGKLNTELSWTKLNSIWKHENCYKFPFVARFSRSPSTHQHLQFPFKLRNFLSAAEKCLSLWNLKIMFFDNHKSTPAGIKLEFNWAFCKHFSDCRKEGNRKKKQSQNCFWLCAQIYSHPVLPCLFSFPICSNMMNFFHYVAYKEERFQLVEKIIFVRHEARRRWWRSLKFISSRFVYMHAAREKSVNRLAHKLCREQSHFSPLGKRNDEDGKGTTEFCKIADELKARRDGGLVWRNKQRYFVESHKTHQAPLAESITFFVVNEKILSRKPTRVPPKRQYDNRRDH